MKRADDVTSKCGFCAEAFQHRPCRKPLFCSVPCYSESMRTKPKNDPRSCVVCETVFRPSRKRGDAKYCSKSCIWKATKGPEFNAKIARETTETRAAKMRGKGTRWYVKRNGRHEHRVVVEADIGRPLTFDEVVHHIDGNKHNNDLSNLMVMSRRDHMREHGIGIPGATLWWEPWRFTSHYKGGK